MELEKLSFMLLERQPWYESAKILINIRCHYLYNQEAAGYNFYKWCELAMPVTSLCTC